MRQSVSRLFGSLPWNQFGDGKKSLFGHPYYLARSALRQEFRRAAKSLPAGPLLDVGCGTMPYRDLFRANEPYECLEIDQPRNQAKNNIDYLYDGHVFPVADHHYGVVFSSQTLEHSFWPEEMLGEVYRVLRPGGLLVLAVPFFWPEHEQPYDSQRFTSFGLVARLEVAGFALLSVTKTNPGLSALIQLLMESIERPLRILSTSRMRALPKSLVMQFFRLLLAPPYAILNFLGSALRWGFRNKDSAELYLDLVIVAEKPEAL